MTDETFFYGEREVTPKSQAGQQVKFAITDTVKKAEDNGAVGTGSIAFSEANHSIYVNGKQYGAVDKSGNDVEETYTTKAAFDSSIADVLSQMGTNQSNLKIFSKIGEIDASSNNSALTITTDGDATIEYDQANFGIKIGSKVYTAEGGITLTDHKFTLDVASASGLGGVKSGGDITVATDGTVTVNDSTHADVADTVDVASATNAETLNIVAVAGAKEGAALKDVSILKLVNGAIQYTGSYTNANDIATKSDVDAVISSAVNGMRYKGSISAEPTTDASVGDFYIVETAFGDAEVGDFLVYNGTSFDIIQRNITETDTISEANKAKIPTAQAVMNYVSDNYTYTADGTYIKLADKQFSHATITTDASSGADITLNSSNTSFNVVTGISNDGHGHITKVVTTKVDVQGAIDTVGDSASRTVDMNKVTEDKEMSLLLATGTDSAEKQEVNLASTITANAGKGTLKVADGTSAVTLKTDGTITATGAISGASITTTGNATIGGNETVTGILQVTGDTTLTTLTTSGDVTVGSATTNVTMKLNGVELDETKLVQSVEATEGATTTASIENGKLSITGVSAIAVDGTASTTNTYNAKVVKETIFWSVL